MKITKCKIRSNAIITVLLIIIVISFGNASYVNADSVTDTISICVGYYGWSEDQYVEKVTYHWTELDDEYGGALDTRKLIYSYYNGSRTYLVAARGFYIRDLLAYAGIDFGSIASIDFFTKDHTNGAYRSFTKQSLFDLPRYYYPNLAANEETGEIYPYDGDDIWNGANRVDAMLALEDYTEWDVSGTDFEQLYDPNMMSPNSRFHLFFGQSRPDEAATSSAAKYCYKLLITFSGTPVLTTDETNLDMKIGSGRKIEVDVDAEDGLLNDYVKSNITWSSSDDSIVTVSPDGTISVLAAGEAVITASFGNSSTSVNVTVGEEPDSEGAGAGSTGNGSLSGGSNPELETSGTVMPGQEQPKPPEPEPEQPEPETEPEPETQTGLEIEETENNTVETVIPKDVKVITVSAKALAGFMKGNTDVEDNHGGQMDEDSEQLVLELREPPDYTLIVLGAVLLAFVSGAAFGIVKFKLSQ